jgi:thiamine biosynthesis lipoprotein
MREVFDYFMYVDEKFSTYKSTSEISAINAGTLAPADYSDDMKEIFMLAEKTKSETDGYFDIINRQGKYDPSGIVKGWAIWNAGKILQRRGIENFFVDAGGDVQTAGLKSGDKNSTGEKWSVGIADPFVGHYDKVVKVVQVSGEGVATSGTAIRGQHIYNPHKKRNEKDDGIYDIVSLTVIGPNIYEADRFATAAFAMGRRGIEFIESIESLEGYMIDKDGMAVMTSGFEKYVAG